MPNYPILIPKNSCWMIQVKELRKPFEKNDVP